MTKRLTLVIAMCWLFPITEQVEAQSDGLFSAVEPTLARSNPRWWTDPDAVPRTIRSRLVRIDFGQLDAARTVVGQGLGDPAPLTLNLFEDTVFAAQVEWSTPTESGYVLSGHLAGEPFGTVTLAVNGTVLAGTVRKLRGTWRIRSAGVGLYLIRQVDLSTLPPEGEPLIRSASDAGADPVQGGASRLIPAADERANPPAATGDDWDIDIIVFYTPEARRSEGGTAEIEALIELWLAETNHAYAASGVMLWLNLVRKEEVAYAEEGGLADDYWRFADPSDGYMDDVYPLREAYAADLMHLIATQDSRDSEDPCGLAVSVVFPGGVQETSSVTGVDCGATTFAHETGHNMGLRHDRYQDGDSDVPYPYSAGYVNQRAFEPGAPESSRWRTVMSYNSQCAHAGFYCTDLFRFSNPDQTHHGDPMGVPGDHPSNDVDGPADARRSLADTRSMVANFRNSSDRIACKPVLAPERQFVPAAGGTFEVAVTIRHDCAWAAVPQAEFVSVTSGASGTGSGVVKYQVAANGGPGRPGGITISGRSVLISQVGPDIEGVCNRTEQVLQAITEAAPVDHCWQVTNVHLAAIDLLPLENQNITTLRARDFAGMTGLIGLRLEGNDLTRLPDGIFAHLSSLAFLQLNDNRLGVLQSGLFAGLPSLDTLYLHGNNLTTLPGGAFAELSSLETLGLDANGLTALPEDAFAGLSSLTSLSFDRNDMTSLPAGVFAGLSNLDRLFLQSGKLTALPGGIFAGLSNLETLWMSDNNLSSLPPGIFRGLSSLENLSFGLNPLRSLPEQVFGGLSKLRWLNLSSAGLTSLPPGIFADLALNGLWLFKNELRTLPAGIFSGRSNFRNLELNGNPGAPFTLTLRLVARERTASGGAVAVEVVEGAPFDMPLSLSVTGGSLSASSTTVGAGHTTSPNVTVTRAGSTATVRPGAPPPIPRGSGCGLPRCITGLELAVSGSVEFSN